MNNPFNHPHEREHTDGDFAPSEVRLSNRNHGTSLEMLRHDITPLGMHYLLIHFDIPQGEAQHWTVGIEGLVDKPIALSLEDLKARAKITLPVTLECAGNGRAHFSPRNRSMPWQYEAVGTSEWTGTPLLPLLEEMGLHPHAQEVVFTGADRGFDQGVEHDYARSMTLEQIAETEPLLIYEMNGLPLLPQHGYPLRLLVPGWFGMASVKWLNRIEVIDHAFQGFQQVRTYMYRLSEEDNGRPVTSLKVKSLMVPPGLRDWYTGEHLVDAGPTLLQGRAWSGNGMPIERVEVWANGTWQEAELIGQPHRFAWAKWQFVWHATEGEHELRCRATDANGMCQPDEPVWNMGGFGNNAPQRVRVSVRSVSL